MYLKMGHTAFIVPLRVWFKPILLISFLTTGGFFRQGRTDGSGAHRAA